MSGFAMFSLKYPSLLQFETQTQVEQQNLQQLYGVEKLCTDSQLRKVLDKPIRALFLVKTFPSLKELYLHIALLFQVQLE